MFQDCSGYFDAVDFTEQVVLQFEECLFCLIVSAMENREREIFSECGTNEV